VYLGDIWPSSDEIYKLLKFAMNGKAFRDNYAKVKSEPGKLWEKDQGRERPDLHLAGQHLHRQAAVLRRVCYGTGAARADSTGAKASKGFAKCRQRRCRAHASWRCSATRSPPTTSRPRAPSRTARRPASGCSANGVQKADFNSYGARRGNHEVMMRGTFANVRIKNLMVPPKADGSRDEGGCTLYQALTAA